MRIRPMVSSVVFLVLALGVAACTSGGAPSASIVGGSRSGGPSGTATAGGGVGAPGSSSKGPDANAKGTVTVTSGGKVVCVITISGGSGSCNVNSLDFKPGSLQFTGSYNPGSGAKIQTNTETVQLIRSNSTPTMMLSTPSLRFGHEQGEQIRVTVKPQFAGTPVGDVTILDGGAPVCVIKLASAAGSCTLRAGQLAVGTHHLFASFPGDTDFKPSVTANQPLTVTK
jgi:hypothetical protein